jgi:DMSO/TMAO reductase YedYZ molybdopterin-dependent catalytic subunit
VTLPPGQRAVEGFPRFGTHLDRRPPEVPTDPVIEIGGAVVEPFAVPVAELATLPRRELTADFHCVAGWSATGLHWEGVPFTSFYRTIVEPALAPGVSVTHLVCEGLDGYRVTVAVEDALGEDVLLADRLDGRPLDGDHGAPARFVSPSQYGFVNAKHLCRIEVHTSTPPDGFGGHPIARLFLRLYTRHPRARVWQEERHRYLPAWSVRVLGRALTAFVFRESARGAPQAGTGSERPVT